MSAENVVPFPKGPDAIISRTVKALAQYRGASRTDMARELGFSRSAFFARLNGTSHWSAEEVQRLADYLSVPVQTLFDGLPGIAQSSGQESGYSDVPTPRLALIPGGKHHFRGGTNDRSNTAVFELPRAAAHIHQLATVTPLPAKAS